MRGHAAAAALGGMLTPQGLFDFCQAVARSGGTGLLRRLLQDRPLVLRRCRLLTAASNGERALDLLPVAPEFEREHAELPLADTEYITVETDARLGRGHG